MSALPPKADIDRARWDVRYVPKADMRATSALRRLVFNDNRWGESNTEP
jgi:hypothetical protein